MRELLAAFHSVTCLWMVVADFNLATQVFLNCLQIAALT